MNLYTDDNPKTTLKGLGFKNKKTALDTIIKVESYFNKLRIVQKVPGRTPNNVLPEKYITNDIECRFYYEKQKMYRILGMLNRARGMINRIKKKDNLKAAIKEFESWMNNYKIRKDKMKGGRKIIDCCDVLNLDNTECKRKSDGKIFKLPRKFSLESCKQGVNGFTMRSSCSPYNDCF